MALMASLSGPSTALRAVPSRAFAARAGAPCAQNVAIGLTDAPVALASANGLCRLAQRLKIGAVEHRDT
jgi:hypothetical protein